MHAQATIPAFAFSSTFYHLHELFNTTVVKEDVSNGLTTLAAVSVLSMPKVGQAEL